MFQRMPVKGSIYKQIITGAGNSNQNVVECNRKMGNNTMAFTWLFTYFLQVQSLVYATISGKLAQLTNNLEQLQSREGFYFKQDGRTFLEITKERLELSRQTRQHDNRADVSIGEILESFKEKEMHPFLNL